MNHRSIGRRSATALVLVAGCLAMSACSSLRPGFEAPTVTVKSFRTLPSQGTMPNFEIGLHVINPNAEPLKLRGVSYAVKLEGQEIIKGVSNQLPVIEGYGEGDVTLTATASLLAGMRVLGKLMSAPDNSVDYALEAKLDVGRFMPPIRVRDEGAISLRAVQQ